MVVGGLLRPAVQTNSLCLAHTHTHTHTHLYIIQTLTTDTGFALGTMVRPPNRLPQKADVLGSGGNGSVFRYFQNGKEFAVKHVSHIDSCVTDHSDAFCIDIYTH